MRAARSSVAPQRRLCTPHMGEPQQVLCQAAFAAEAQSGTVCVPRSPHVSTSSAATVLALRRPAKPTPNPLRWRTLLACFVSSCALALTFLPAPPAPSRSLLTSVRRRLARFFSPRLLDRCLRKTKFKSCRRTYYGALLFLGLFFCFPVPAGAPSAAVWRLFRLADYVPYT